MKKMLLLLAAAVIFSNEPVSASGHSLTSEIEFLGQVVFNTGHIFQNTEVGGLSGLAFDPSSGDYLCISDDKGLINPARFYRLRIELGDGRLEPGDIVFSEVITLKQASGQPYSRRTLDPEGIAIGGSGGNVFICSEGDVRHSTKPWVAEFSPRGQFLRKLGLPSRFVTSSDSTGFRNNANLESLTLAPSGLFLFTSVEHSLKEDGPLPDTRTSSMARIVKYDLAKDRVVRECFYEIDRIVLEPDRNGLYGRNGMVELIAMDDSVLLVLERSYIPGAGNRVKLFRIDSRNAADVSDHNGTPGLANAPKESILDLSSLGLPLDNFEGMALGPALPDGRRTLILVSDNNFNESQRTLFFAFAFGRTNDSTKDR